MEAVLIIRVPDASFEIILNFMRVRGVEITNVLKVKLEELLFFISKVLVHVH